VRVTETGCEMLGVERVCMESAGKSTYVWNACVWKGHVKSRQQSDKECAAGKESACVLETMYLNLMIS